MEVYRYRRTGQANNIRVSKSVTTLPAWIILSLGLAIVIAAIVLFTAYGIPSKNVSQNLKSLSGPIVLVVGLVVFIGGISYGVHLNQKEKQRRREERKQQAEMQKQARQISLQIRHQLTPPYTPERYPHDSSAT